MSFSNSVRLRVEFSSNQYSTVMTCKHNELSMSDYTFKEAIRYSLRSHFNTINYRRGLKTSKEGEETLSWLQIKAVSLEESLRFILCHFDT